MKRIYVETNFLVDFLRPLPRRDAERLYARIDSEFVLTVPWCSLKETERTLDRIIREDLGFHDQVGRFKAQLNRASEKISAEENRAIDMLLLETKNQKKVALKSIQSDLEAFVERIDVIAPTRRAAELAIATNRQKRLNPFDEMMLGCVLADAEERKSAGESSFFFCDKDKDFDPSAENGLLQEYQSRGISYLSHFKVP